MRGLTFFAISNIILESETKKELGISENLSVIDQNRMLVTNNCTAMTVYSLTDAIQRLGSYVFPKSGSLEKKFNEKIEMKINSNFI